MQESNWGDLSDEAVAKLKMAVREGISDALTDPHTADALVSGMYDAFQRHAQETAGRTVVGLVKAALTKGVFMMIAGAIIYSLGGWAAVVGFWKMLVAKGS